MQRVLTLPGSDTKMTVMADGFTYSVLFRNQSSNANYGCLFWASSSVSDGGFPVAWLSKYVFPTTTVSWSWQMQYSFVWSDTGKLQSGTMVASSQVWPASLDTNNVVTLTYQRNAFTFQNQRTGDSGTLTILEDGTIPAGQASAGIGLGGYATYMVQAQPNLTPTFTPASQSLSIAFGNYPRGTVLSTNVPNAKPIVFPTNVYSMTATLSSANQWTVEPTSDVNARFARAREQDVAADWTRI